MIVSRLTLKNWRNFQFVDVPLRERVFLAGPNASGKSNFLDVFRFLRDIPNPGGGLQKAVSDWGGFSKICCLATRRHPDIELEVYISTRDDQPPSWRYSIGIKKEVCGYRQLYLSYERVWRDG